MYTQLTHTSFMCMHIQLSITCITDFLSCVVSACMACVLLENWMLTVSSWMSLQTKQSPVGQQAIDNVLYTYTYMMIYYKI